MTGQDRTGQDRTGQDRTGQDRTGQDREGMSSVSSLFHLNAMLCISHTEACDAQIPEIIR